VRVAAFIGPSGSGKTTLIVALIRHFAVPGQRVAAIKHTHHPLNEEHRGNTAAFEAAGAEPVILAGDGQAVVFSPGGTSRVRFESPDDLLALTAADIVLVEGFKRYDRWPQIEVDRTSPLSLADALAILDRIWAAR